jgi:hypothetical protein
MVRKGAASRAILDTWRPYLLPISVLLPLGLCLIPLIAGNYGWSIGAQIPFPVMILEDTKNYFWATFYSPMVAIVGVQMILCLDAVYGFYVIDSKSLAHRSNREQRKTSKAMRVLQYNREALSLLVLVGVFTIITAGCVAHTLVDLYDKGNAGFEKYLGCLLANFDAPSECHKEDYYDNAIEYIQLEIIYICAYGLIALITFAPSTAIWRAFSEPKVDSGTGKTSDGLGHTNSGQRSYRNRSKGSKLRSSGNNSSQQLQGHLSTSQDAESKSQANADSKGVGESYVDMIEMTPKGGNLDGAV